MLSYHARLVSQLGHAEPGETIERRSGIRAATTFRKLPTARPGARTTAANSTFIRSGLRRARSGRTERRLERIALVAVAAASACSSACSLSARSRAIMKSCRFGAAFAAIS